MSNSNQKQSGVVGEIVKEQQVVLMDIDAVIPYEKNPRKNDHAAEEIAGLIKRFGFRFAIHVDKNNVIISGHTRHKAAKILGLEKVPVVVDADLSAEDAKALRLADNRALLELRQNGLFDFVICDYVCNSVDSVKAIEDVLTCLGALCKPGGTVMFSGRRLERVLEQVNYTKTAPRHRLLEFLDENNMTALYRRGHWHFQKFVRQMYS